MVVYDSQITRADAQALVPEDAATEIISSAVEESSFLQLARRLPNMSSAQRRLPVWNALATAYFVNGDTGLKQTTDGRWDNVYINAEEIAVIVPIPENVLDDADYDIWTEMQPQIREAIGLAVDEAVYFGVNAPSTWPEGIAEVAATVGNVVEEGNVGDLYDDLMGEGGVLSKVEEDGYMVNGHVAALRMRAKLRGLRDDNGVPIFTSARMTDGPTQYSLDGERLIFPRNGSMNPARCLLISGDFDQAVYAIRKDITYKVLTEAVIQDGSGAIVYNLAQQDMVALRVVFRMGWAVPNPINRVNSNNATRFPFAIYRPVAQS